ncbi:MAG: type IV toxin-antitoxin system AbiEi family antitoxin [Flavobacteriales bacterium]|nr:type IV toxin-antitoxin system AbiEi family antitoxin [Flavobacteriales bacterium]
MPVVAEYINQLQSYEEYSFSWEELLQHSNTSESTLRKELARLADRNEILNLRKGFYLIISPRYRNLGKLPVQLYVEKLFTCLEKNYYVGLYSAAAFHGASHQQTQLDYIITAPPALRDIKKEKTTLRFFKSTHWPKKNIMERKSDAGLFKISSPALTAADLIHHQAKIGGLNRLLANLEELTEEITPTDINDLLSWYPHKSTLQRLGYLMDKLDVQKNWTDPIYIHLNKKKYYPILLTPKNGVKAGSSGNRWKIDVNIELDSDL